MWERNVEVKVRGMELKSLYTDFEGGREENALSLKGTTKNTSQLDCSPVKPILNF